MIDKGLKCPVCHYYIHRLALATAHILEHHKIKTIYLCTMCMNSFNEIEEIIIHQNLCQGVTSIITELETVCSLEKTILCDINQTRCLNKAATDVFIGKKSLDYFYETLRSYIECNSNSDKENKPNNNYYKHLPIELQLQKLWQEDKRSLWNVILKDNDLSGTNIPINEALCHFYPHFAYPNGSKFRPLIVQKLNTLDFMTYITQDEIEKQMSNKKKSTKRSIDNITRNDLMRNIKIVQIFLNLCLLKEKIPKIWKRTMTILIKKDINAKFLTDYRPINISMVMYRTLMGIISKRINQMTTKMENQPNFSSSDANTEVVTTIRYLYETQKCKIAMVDISKPLKGVNQTVVLDVLRAHGFKMANIQFLQYVFADSTTYLSLDKKISDDIPNMMGLKDGDPLSKIAKLLIIDQLLRRIEDGNKGVLVTNNCSLSAVAQNDILFLFAETKDNLEQQLRLVFEFVFEIGQSIYDIEVNVYRTTDMLQVYDRVIHPTYILQYQGANIVDPIDYRDQIEQFSSYILKVNKNPLLPYQKLYLLKSHIIPKMLFHLSNENFTLKILKIIDRMIKKTIDEWFPDNSENRLSGIIELSVEVPQRHIKNLEGLKLCNAWFIKEIITTDWFRNKLNNTALMNHVPGQNKSVPKARKFSKSSSNK